MFEKRNPAKMMKGFEFPTDDLWVVVNEFDSYTLKDFIKDCEKVLNTGQTFLPVIIDSYGGQVYTLLGMADFLSHVSHVGVKVITICEAKAMSCGAWLLSCGDERYMGKNSTIMIHEISSGFWGKNIDFQNDAKELARLNKKLYTFLDRNSGQPKGYWEKLVDKNKRADLFLTPEQALKHKLITHIGVPHIETTLEVRRELVL